ncbi:MAG: acyl carrier protein [Bacteroidales bacterium]|nr:acyl carrier protein [Bacteroidales bacterium]
MQIEEVIKIVNEFLIDEFELEKTQLKPEAKLKEDLDIESLDFVDIAVVIDKEFGIKVKGEEMTGVKTLGDLYNYIKSKAN